MASLLILTEGGEGIGLGHISRCSAIIKQYSGKGFKAEMVIDWYGNEPAPEGYKILNWRQDKLTDLDYAAVLVDSYRASLEDIALLKDSFKKVFVIDDYGRFYDYGVDLIINPNIYAAAIPYAAAYVGGRDYVILREAFINTPAKATPAKEVEKIMVTMGGSDYRSLLPNFVEMFGSALFHFDFLCSSNQYATDLSAKYSEHKNCRFYGFLSPVDMRDKMLEADIAISACGQTLHELAFLGLPTIGIVIDNDQEYNSSSYLESGVLHSRFYWNEQKLKENILESINSLVDYNRRVTLSNKALTLIDGKGIERIADTIQHYAA